MKNKRFKVVIECASEEDANWIRKIAGKCGESEGSPGSLWWGILAAVLRRATVKD